MNAVWYTKQITDELEGASTYVHKAIKCKSAHPDWAETYIKMSDGELSHAEKLIEMFEEAFKEETVKMEVVPEIYPNVRDNILEMYAENVAKVKIMQQTYIDL